MRDKVIQSIRDSKVIAILRNVDSDRIQNVAQSLYAGGIRLLEITFNQDDAISFDDTARQIKMLCTIFDEKMYIGAGTVMTPEQVQIAKDAGASFIISPNVSREVIEKTVTLGMVSIPGAMTPTEIVDAHRYGADLVKVFPSSNLGIDYIKAIRAPLSNISLVAVGGVDASNVAAFADAGCCGFGIGGRLVNKEAIRSGNYETLTKTAEEILAALR